MPPPEGWANAYIGIPYRVGGRTRLACDCWGLVRIVFADLGIDLPSYETGYACRQELAEYAAGFENADRSEWLPAEQHEPLNFITFRRAGYVTHIGMIVRRGIMLHADEHGPSRIERYDDPRWNRRVAAVYRHARLGAGAVVAGGLAVRRADDSNRPGRGDA